MHPKKGATNSDISCQAKELDQDELEIEKLLKQSLLDEIIAAVYDSRYLATVVALIAIFFAYHLTIAPHHAYEDNSPLSNLNLVRSF
jgi:hypothetical protein